MEFVLFGFEKKIIIENYGISWYFVLSVVFWDLSIKNNKISVRFWSTPHTFLNSLL